MSELVDFDTQDEENLPPLDGGLSVGYYLRSVVGRLGDGGLLYTDYVNPDSNCHVAVNAHDLEVVGSIKGYEISQSLLPPLHETVSALEQRVSKAMAWAAVRYGFEHSVSQDPEYDYPVYISPAEGGAVSLMSRDPNIQAMVIGNRPGSYEQPLRIQSRNIEQIGELRVLLSGLAVFLTATETIKQHTVSK